VGGALSDLRRSAGTHVPELRARVVVSLEERGLTRAFRGADRDTLSLLAGAVAAASPAEGAPARAYHYDGVAVRDLRTGAFVTLARDLKKGALEPLRQAWELQRP
jgi:hypothetical protein